MVEKNLTKVEKTQIGPMYKDGKSITQIAKEMGLLGSVKERRPRFFLK